MRTLRCIAFAPLFIFYPTNPHLSLRAYTTRSWRAEASCSLHCWNPVCWTKLCLLTTSQVVEGCGKRSKAKSGPLVEKNNPENDWERTADGSSHMLLQAAVRSIPVLSWQSSAGPAISITYGWTCAEPQEESALYSPEQLQRASAHRMLL